MEQDKSKIKLVLVDDHQMLLDGLAALLQGEQRFDLVGLCNNAKYALELLETTAPDIVITDINMPEISGVELTRMIRKYHPKIKVLALSMFGERSTISEMLEAGISGYILKNTGKEELINALLKVQEGGMYFSDEITEELIKSISQKRNQNLLLVLARKLPAFVRRLILTDNKIQNILFQFLNKFFRIQTSSDRLVSGFCCIQVFLIRSLTDPDVKHLNPDLADSKSLQTSLHSSREQNYNLVSSASSSGFH